MTLGCGESRKDTTATSPARTVKFVGFDSSPPLIEAMKQGQLQGLVIQNPYRMGELGVKTLVAALKKESVEANISTGETLVTPENMNSAAVTPLLNPPKGRIRRRVLDRDEGEDVVGDGDPQGDDARVLEDDPRGGGEGRRGIATRWSSTARSTRSCATSTSIPG